MNYYAGLVANTWQNNILHSVLLELTYNCGLDCFFCYNERARAGRLLTPEQYRRLLDDLAKMNVLHLALSGGEPLTHPGFWEIAGQARTNGFVIRLKSNGHLIGERFARRLKREVAPFVVEVSLHGACAATHDRQTRVKGSFHRLMRNVQSMLQAGLRVQLNTVLTEWNQPEIDEMYGIADRFGVCLQVDPNVTPRNDGDRSPLSIGVGESAFRHLREIQRARLSGAPSAPEAPDASASQAVRETAVPECEKFCGAGSSGLAVDPFGEVYPCVQWRVPLGSLHSQTVEEIWENSAALKRVRALNVEMRRRFKDWADDVWFCPRANGDADQSV